MKKKQNVRHRGPPFWTVPWRPGRISVTSFHPRVCFFFWFLVWLLLKPERAGDWKMLCGVLVRDVQPCRRMGNVFVALNGRSRSPRWKLTTAVVGYQAVHLTSLCFYSKNLDTFCLCSYVFAWRSLHLWTTWTLVKYAVTLHVRCQVKSTFFIKDIPYQYLRFFVKMAICTLGKLTTCNRFWIEEKKYIQLLHA